MKDLRPPTCSAHSNRTHSTPIQPRTPTHRAPTPENDTENTEPQDTRERSTHTETPVQNGVTLSSLIHCLRTPTVFNCHGAICLRVRTAVSPNDRGKRKKEN